VAASSRDSVVDLALFPAEASATIGGSKSDILQLFDRCAPQLLHYVASFGLGPEETEDIVQETFLALFRHLLLGRSQANLIGWLFQVAHNLALKQRGKIRRRLAAQDFWNDTLVYEPVDPAPNPETRLVQRERHRRLQSVVHALPERERRCLFLRAEGLTYRDIAKTLSLSLGGVAKSLTRAMTRLVNADGG
jgi:RNA polymerase sigma-70 factor (ECF subfamily)